MTEIDISKVLIEGDTATIMGVKYKRVETPQTLWKMLDKEQYYPDRCDNICNIVKEWMSQYDCDYASCKEYLEGYTECQTVLEERLK